MAVRRRLFLVAAVLVLVLILAAAAPVQSGGPFVGPWWAIDPFDGSTEYLSIERRYVDYGVRSVDLMASSCGGPPAAVLGPGVLSDDEHMHTSLKVVCLGGNGNVWTGLDLDLVYDSATDTLRDAFGTIWHRLPVEWP